MRRDDSKPRKCWVRGCHEFVPAALLRTSHRITTCLEHRMASSVLIDNVEKRFCQQCTRFHETTRFDGDKRSCRSRLVKLNARRNKDTDGRHTGKRKFADNVAESKAFPDEVGDKEPADDVAAGRETRAEGGPDLREGIVTGRVPKIGKRESATLISPASVRDRHEECWDSGMARCNLNFHDAEQSQECERSQWPSARCSYDRTRIDLLQMAVPSLIPRVDLQSKWVPTDNKDRNFLETRTGVETPQAALTNWMFSSHARYVAVDHQAIPAGLGLPSDLQYCVDDVERRVFHPYRAKEHKQQNREG